MFTDFIFSEYHNLYENYSNISIKPGFYRQNTFRLFFLFSACNHFPGVCELSHPVSSVGMFTLSYILSLFSKLYLTHTQMSGSSVHLTARPALLPLLQRSPLKMPSTFLTLWQWNPIVCILLSAFSFVRFSILLLIAKLQSSSFVDSVSFYS